MKFFRESGIDETTVTRKLLLGVTVLSMLFAWAAMAAEQPEGYPGDAREVTARDSVGDYWRTGCGTPAMATYEYDPELLPKPVNTAEAPESTPVPVPANYGEPEKISLSSDQLFDFDKTNLKPEGKQALDDLVSKPEGIKYHTIVVIGYAGRIGSEAYNKKLSVRRAEAVKSYLVNDKSLAADSIFTGGKGEANPVIGDTCKGHEKTKAPIACLQPDRRVEVEVALHTGDSTIILFQTEDQNPAVTQGFGFAKLSYNDLSRKN